MAEQPKEPKHIEDQPSPDFVSLKEFFSVFAKFITVLIGFGALYLLFGYSIILSYISTIKLYGLTSFTSDFYKEATINFIKNMLETYGDHILFTYGIVLILFLVFVLLKTYGNRLEKYSKYIEVSMLIITILVILSTLRLGYLYDDFYNIHNAKELFLFDVSVPFLIILLCYLATSFRVFYLKPYTAYYVTFILTIILFFSIPISYGKDIFDIVLYPIVRLEVDSNSKSMVSLQKDINNQGSIPLFYFMGYATDKLILFDNQTLSPPAKMIILSKDAIKYINISNDLKNKLRNMVRCQKYYKINPVPQPGSKLAFESMSSSSFQNDGFDGQIPDPSLTLIKPGKGIGSIELGDSINTTIRKMKKSPSMARKILYPDQAVEYWLNYEDLGLAFIFDSTKTLSKIAINNPTMVLKDYKIMVKGPISDLFDTFGEGNETKHEEGFKLVTYPAEGVSFTVSPKEGKIFTIMVFKRSPAPQGPQPLDQRVDARGIVLQQTARPSNPAQQLI